MSNVEEPLAEFYYNQLRETTNPVGTLVAFYRSLFDVDKADESTYKMFARLYKIYGKELIYFALLDCADMENINFDSSIARLISYFAKKRLGDSTNFNLPVDLTFLVKQFEKNTEKVRKVKINLNPFEDEPNE
jgi:hypothetical protein